MNALVIAILSFLIPITSYGANEALVETLFAQPYTASVYSGYTTMADRIRICQRVMGAGTDTNYVLQCLKRKELTEVQERRNSMRLFFVNDDSIISAILGDDRFLYINVLTDVAPGQICYRIIREVDETRDGYYAVEVCEYN